MRRRVREEYRVRCGEKTEKEEGEGRESGRVSVRRGEGGDERKIEGEEEGEGGAQSEMWRGGGQRR